MVKYITIKEDWLKAIIKEPHRLGTRDKYIQEGVKYLAEKILNGNMELEVY